MMPQTWASTERQRLKRVAHRYHVHGDFDAHGARFGAQMVLQHAQGSRALEVGCADGVMTRLLAERFPRLVVVEGSARYVAMAKRRVAGLPVEFHVSLIEDFKTQERFDTIVCAHLLEHVASPATLLRAIRRLLSPRGSLHVIVPNAGSLHRRLGVAMGLLSRRNAFSDRDRLLAHRRVYDRALLVRHMKQASLRADTVEGILLKPLSNAQMRRWDPKLIEALFRIGRELPEWCNDLYVRCR